MHGAGERRGRRPLQVHSKNNAAPLAGRRAFSVHVWHRRRRVIFAAFTSGNREGIPPKGRKGANLPGNDIPRVFYIPIIYFQRRYASTDFPTVTSRQSKGTSGSCPLIASPPEGGEDLKKLISRKDESRISLQSMCMLFAAHYCRDSCTSSR